MKKIIQIFGGLLLLYSILGLALHALANLDSFGHRCSLLLIPEGENHLQVFTAAAAIAGVFFLIVKAINKKRQRKPV